MAIKQVTAVQAMEEISKGKIITASLNEMQGAWIALADCEDGRVLTCAYSGECQAAALFAKKDSGKVKNITVDVMELNPNNAAVVRRYLKWTGPQAQGGKGISIAFSDCLAVRELMPQCPLSCVRHALYLLITRLPMRIF